jgi:hypothetical protein
VGGKGSRKVAILFNDIIERKTAERKLRARLEHLDLLHRITGAIGERQDLHNIFQVVIRTLEDRLPIDFGCFCLYDVIAKQLTVACVGLCSEALAMDLALTEQARIGIDPAHIDILLSKPPKLREIREALARRCAREKTAASAPRAT